jgi:ABC-type nickel/cobalt efflux system permease component RcnA
MVSQMMHLKSRKLFGTALGSPFAIAIAIAMLGSSPRVGHADTVASLLGNFTVNQYCGLKLANDALDVHYVVVFGQLPALRELHLADADRNGVTTQTERDAYVGTLAPGFAKSLILRVNGVSVPLHATHWTSSLPTEQGGFSLRVDVELAAALPAAVRGAPRRLEFSNENYAGQMGWHEIVVEPAPQLTVYDTNAFDSSLTGGLTEALKILPAAGPLDERAVHLSFGTGDPPAHAKRLSGRSGTDAELAADPAKAASKQFESSSESSWIAKRTRQLVEAISSPTVEPGVAFLTLLGALLLGAVHALSPGHGKTIVGAYLIGSRGTPRHAVFLGVTVTVTHTLGVFGLGFATLYASRFIVPERLFPILSLVSALLVLGMGITLLIRRGRSAREALAAAAGLPVFQAIAPMTSIPGTTRKFVLAPGAQYVDATLHSHGGGPLHSHLPPGSSGEKITWRSLLALGISGGLVPCPSAMVLLLAAVALNKTAYGMLLVTAFSVGLAITLTVVGLAFLHARNRFTRPGASTRWTQLVPVLSAATITLLGAALCFAALKSFA